MVERKESKTYHDCDLCFNTIEYYSEDADKWQNEDVSRDICNSCKDSLWDFILKWRDITEYIPEKPKRKPKRKRGD